MTDSFFGGSHGVPADERCRINRPYARVSRDKMQANLKTRLAAAGVTKITGKVDAKTVRAREVEREGGARYADLFLLDTLRLLCVFSRHLKRKLRDVHRTGVPVRETGRQDESQEESTGDAKGARRYPTLDYTTRKTILRSK